MSNYRIRAVISIFFAVGFGMIGGAVRMMREQCLGARTTDEGRIVHCEPVETREPPENNDE